MRVVSVNVGRPTLVPTADGTVLTSIFKSPVAGSLAVRGNNIEGDQQADLRAHGGPYKAIYCYPEEHYSFWRDQLPDMELVPGMFGENLTTRGLTENTVRIGDLIRFGSTVLKVTQPRMPCYKLGIRFGRPDMVKLFWMSSRPGIYFSVVEEGELESGDAIERIGGEPEGISIADLLALYRGAKTDPELLQRALSAPLFGRWKQGLRERCLT